MKSKWPKIMLVLLTTTLLLFALAHTALADKPMREFVPAAPVTLSGFCAFDVRLEPLTNNEYVTTLTNKDGTTKLTLITGALTVRLTNLSSGNALDLNIPGPGRQYLWADGTATLITEGPWLYLVPPGFTPRMFFISGQTVGTFDAVGNLTSLTIKGGRVVDICAALQ